MLPLSRIVGKITSNVRLLMTHTEHAYVAEAANLIPRLTSAQHKGQCGRIGIVGGSIEYTGAPFYAAITTLRLGGDVVHIFCAPSAANAIKSYSPEVIVHPILTEDTTKLRDWLSRMNAVVVGPGLGRDDYCRGVVEAVVEVTKEQRTPLVVDADGLWFVNDRPSMVEGHPCCTLTPNRVEYDRLVRAVLHADDAKKERVVELATILKCSLIVKGDHDLVVSGGEVVECESPGCLRRCGGQGDLLSGATALMLHWSNTSPTPPSSPCVPLFAACSLIRRCAALTFAKEGRAMTANDMVGHIGEAAKQLFDTW